MKTLLEALTENTQDLKAEYISNTKIWATDRFNSLLEKLSWNEVQWCEYFGLTPRLCNYHGTEVIPYDPNRKLTGMQFWSLPSNFYNSRDARRQDSMKNEARQAKRLGLGDFVLMNVVKAEAHYDDSLRKLVDRLKKKGVPETFGEKVKIIKARVGINLEIVIKFEAIQVKAWTIVAEGIVQRPHYRYLVK